MTIQFVPQGVCPSLFEIEVEDGVVKSLRAVDGCDGNLKGIASLIEGMKTEDVISRMEGIRCGRKLTSCPDQIAQALKQTL